MRNLLLYPITTDEIVEVLRQCSHDYDKLVESYPEEERPIGDTKPLLFEEAIRRLSNQDCWCVIRQGDDGNRVVVRDGMTNTAARDLYDFLRLRDHHQSYDLCRETEVARENFLNKPAKEPK